MNINQRIELTAEEREAIEKKDRRNDTITTVITVASTVFGFLVARHLSKQLNAEIDSVLEAKTEEVEND